MMKNNNSIPPPTDLEDESLLPKKSLIYGVTDRPPWYSVPILSLQQSMTTLSGTVSVVFIIHNKVCAEGDNLFFAELISTSLFMCGLCTFLEVLFGIRLPIVQGGSAGYLPPIIAMMELSKWQCPTIQPGSMNTSNSNSSSNSSFTADQLWRPRLNEINGGLLLASLVHIVLGASGVMGFLMRFIGPLTITPTISLIGLGLVPTIIQSAEQHWGVTIMTALFLIVFSIYIGNVPICFPVKKKQQKWSVHRIYIFRMIPVILGLGAGWLMCHILTVTGSLPSDPNSIGFKARTDARSSVLQKANWFFLPYPFRFGIPTFSFPVFVGMTSATISSVIESIGVYSAIAKICDLRYPPSHAVNRGLAVEGFGSVLSAMFGAGHATTSYSSAMGFVGVTKVGSRIVWYGAGLILMVLAVIGKLGAFLAIIPDPVIGGYLLVGMGMVVAVGLSNLKTVNLQSSRNIMILGVSIMIGLIIPTYLRSNPNAINTGVTNLDQVLSIFLKTSMFIGGVVAFILDNTVPGSREERGFVTKAVNNANVSDGEDTESHLYRLPLINALFERVNCCQYNPTSPTFDQEKVTCRCSCCKRQVSALAGDSVKEPIESHHKDNEQITKM